MRSRVVPEVIAERGGTAAPTTRAAPSPREASARPPPTYRVPWAALLKKVFAIDVLVCPKCTGRLELIAFIADQGIARKILEHLELDATGPPAAAARRVPESIDPAPDYDVADPIYDA
jgi:hypothetical protein